MKKITFILVLFLLSATALAQEGASDWFVFSQKGPQVGIISQDVSMAGLDYAYTSPTAVDNSGNFFYCLSEGNPNGYLWIIKKVDRTSGSASEVCRLNLDKYKSGSIRAINFSGSSLYVWLSLTVSGSKGWIFALAEITGL